MKHEAEDQNEEQPEGFTMKHFSQMMAIAFVVAIYFVIFLKVLFIK